MKIKIREFPKSNEHNVRSFISRTILPPTEKRINVEKWWKYHKNDEIEILDFDNFLRLFSKVNMEIKTEEGKPRRNKFYKYKHKFLKYALENNMVNEIIDSGDYIKLGIQGLQFHQLKEQFKNITLVFNGEEKYEPYKDTFPSYSEQDFITCILNIGYQIYGKRSN